MVWPEVASILYGEACHGIGGASGKREASAKILWEHDPAGLLAGLFDAEQFDIKEQDGIGRDDTACAT